MGCYTYRHNPNAAPRIYTNKNAQNAKRIRQYTTTTAIATIITLATSLNHRG